MQPTIESNYKRKNKAQSQQKERNNKDQNGNKLKRDQKEKSFLPISFHRSCVHVCQQVGDRGVEF